MRPASVFSSIQLLNSRVEIKLFGQFRRREGETDRV